MKEFLKMLVGSIVENPQDIKIQSSKDETGTLLTLRVNKKDMGTLIGRKGEHISAIKLITKLVGFRKGKKVFIKVEEPDNKPKEVK